MSDRELLDADGENRAVRAFLMIYGTPGLTIGKMRTHMTMSGHPHWPDWAEDSLEHAHLTKGGAQHWLRHLFALEVRHHE